MTAQTFLYIIPRLPATAIARCKRETQSNSKLSRDRKARRRPTSANLRDEEVGNFFGRQGRAPLSAFFILEHDANGSDCFRLSSARSSAPARIGREWQPARAGRGKGDKRQNRRAPYCLRTGHETLLGFIPTQGKQNFLTLLSSSQSGPPDELPIRLKKNRYKELLGARDSLKNQEGLDFQAMICAIELQRELLSRTTECTSASWGALVRLSVAPQPSGSLGWIPGQGKRQGTTTERCRGGVVPCRGAGEATQVLRCSCCSPFLGGGMAL
jgi:hypothetical protein